MKKELKAIKLGALAVASVFFMMSCNSSSSSNAAAGDSTNTGATDTSTAAQAAPATDSSAAQQKFTDPQIASIAVTGNQIDIDYAKIAQQKTTNKQVKEFAATMAKDHQAVIDKAVALAKKLGVTPEDNPTTQSLLDGAAKEKSVLNAASGAAFDKAYIDNEVEFHKAVISLVETRLIPESTNPELKALLQSAVPLFKTHLEHAEMVQKAVDK